MRRGKSSFSGWGYDRPLISLKTILSIRACYVQTLSLLLIRTSKVNRPGYRANWTWPRSMSANKRQIVNSACLGLVRRWYIRIYSLWERRCRRVFLWLVRVPRCRKTAQDSQLYKESRTPP
jgi:hypothetical protein